MDFWRIFPGPNAAYALELYEKYRLDPESVDPATRAYFSRWTPPVDGALPTVALAKLAGAIQFANAIRTYGHLAAHLDPLGSEPPGHPALSAEFHDLSEADLRELPASVIGGPVAQGATNALEAVRRLFEVYAGPVGYEFGHIEDFEERAWLQEAVESGRYWPNLGPEEAIALLDRLTQVDVFEQFLHRAFPGRTRFSIEGVDMLVPMLDWLIRRATAEEVRQVFVAMTHRGRLNVMAHIFGKPYAELLAYFREATREPSLDGREGIPIYGDVHYHLGGQRVLADGRLVLTMPPNPSHLEAVYPVVEGMARAVAADTSRPGAPRVDPGRVLPIVIHGDAAFSGQGVVAETLNLYRLPGYTVGGTVHIIANNQIGYTTEPVLGRSTRYATDLVKGFGIPVAHVNADDPVACLAAVELAFAYRQRFGKDFVVDLIGYRRYGHNEGDEPSFTQPLMYEAIGRHPTVRQLWAERLVRAGTVGADVPETLREKYLTEWRRTFEAPTGYTRSADRPKAPPPRPRPVETGVPLDRLRAIYDAWLTFPPNFNLNPRLERALRRRRVALDNPGEPNVDFATAEGVAIATILADGIPVRLAGQDTGRGTFSQRHAILYDVRTGRQFIPLQALPQARAAFEVVDSPLSENAALAFELGYNLQVPERLVIWEAQYGDFVNAAQVPIDEFLVSGRAKWGLTPSLVLLLPHGYEGQGPDHSSGRMERFLSLVADNNMLVANPSTAAQYFHLLRRQAALLREDPRPLVVFTPKSLLRNPAAFSALRELAEGRWQPVLDDPAVGERGGVRRLVLCSGKVYYDAVADERRALAREMAIIRVEELYPFPAEELRALLASYPAVEEVIWLQEEPENMGAWTYIRPKLEELIGGRWSLRYIGRPPASSPAEGSMAQHVANQRAIIEQLYAPRELPVPSGR